jgi:hypothetical protein
MVFDEKSDNVGEGAGDCYESGNSGMNAGDVFFEVCANAHLIRIDSSTRAFEHTGSRPFVK